MRKTFGQTRSNESGFTITELIIVIALIAMITFFALPSLTNSFKASLNATALEMATTTKEAYNSSVLRGRVHRVVYDLKERSFWVESGPPVVLLDTVESKEREERRVRIRGEEAATPEPTFALDKTITRKKVSLPRGVEFEDVFTEQEQEPITEGKAFTHIFPHGLTEQTIVHLKDASGRQVSLIVSALSGRTLVENRYVEPEEVYGTD